MIPEPNKLERFFSRYEFTVEHLLCAADVDGYPLGELLDLADDESRALWDGLTLGYTETAGHPALRAQIAEQYEHLGADDIVVCAGGAVEALFLLTTVLLDAGGHLAMTWPAFEPLHRVAHSTGAAITELALDPATGWGLDPDAVRAALWPDTRALVVNFPHNPTGALPDRATFQALVESADERGVRVVSDEVYRYLEFDPALRLPTAADLSERAVSVGVMSKAYGLAGLRIGWIASRDAELLRSVTRLKDYTSVCASAPAEILSLIALRAGDQVVGRCLGIITENLAQADAFFRRWPDLFDWIPPRAGMVAFPRLTAPVPVDEFVTDLVETEGVLLLPGTVFDDTRNRFRIGLGRASLPKAIARLEDFVTRRFG